MFFVLFLLTLAAVTALYGFLGNPFWLKLVSDKRGVAATLSDNVLADRGDGGGACNMPRIPAGRYPAFSTTLRGTTDANGNAQAVFETERDVLFIGMSATIPDAAPASAHLTMTYCQTKLLDHSSAQIWQLCCDRKPIFLVGVADNKRLEFAIGGATPASAFKITMHGFQGKGCCD